ncbi:hypothetical protein MP228_007201 [Amoeboaphelidium protococcarum]|nr:hypothetical protein MP228_007201 [Amoeboaphelidium protococcarum]
MTSLLNQLYHRVLTQGDSQSEDDVGDSDLASPLLLMAHQHITSLVRPAVKTVVNNIIMASASSSSLPFKIPPQVNLWFDELYLMFQLLVEARSLMQDNATMLEHLYGVERSLSRKSFSSRRVLFIYIIQSIILPYIVSKCDGYQQDLKDFEERRLTIDAWYSARGKLILSEQSHSQLFGRLIYFIKLVLLRSKQFIYKLMEGHYSNISIVVRLCNLAVKLLYFVGMSKYWSLSHFLTGIRYINSHARQQQQQLNGKLDWTRSIINLSVVALYFSEWWTDTGYKQIKQGQKQSLIVPPPSTLMFPQRQCPICAQDTFKNEVLLKETGVVYCHDCLKAYIHRVSKSADTFKEMILSNRIIKIYL